MKYNEGTYSFGLYSVWELQANNSFIYKKVLIAYNSHVMQSIGMGLCMQIHL